MENTPKKQFSQAEVDERVAILKRLRQLLEQQRQKFRDYLVTLEKQETAIAEGDADAISAHTEIEEHIISNIYVIQKAIIPMEDMYRTVYPGAPSPLPQIKDELGHLQEQIIEQNKKNRELLSSCMTSIRQQILSIKNPYAKKRSIYSSDSRSAGIIDITQ